MTVPVPVAGVQQRCAVPIVRPSAQVCQLPVRQQQIGQLDRARFIQSVRVIQQRFNAAVRELAALQHALRHFFQSYGSLFGVRVLSDILQPSRMSAPVQVRQIETFQLVQRHPLFRMNDARCRLLRIFDRDHRFYSARQRHARQAIRRIQSHRLERILQRSL